MAARSSADGAELAHLQRVAPSMPPLCNLPLPLLLLQETSSKWQAEIPLNRIPTGGFARAQRENRCMSFFDNLPCLIDDFGEIGGVLAARSGKAAGIVGDMSDANIDI